MSSGIPQRLPKTITVTVANGQGSSYINNAGGNVVSTSVKAPTTVATWEISIWDTDDFPLMGREGMVGHMPIQEEYQSFHDHKKSTNQGLKIMIEGTDGEYSIRLFYKAG